MELAAFDKAPDENSVSQGRRFTLTVFSEVWLGCSPRPTCLKELHLHEKPSHVPSLEMTTDFSHVSCGQQTALIPIQGVLP